MRFPARVLRERRLTPLIAKNANIKSHGTQIGEVTPRFMTAFGTSFGSICTLFDSTKIAPRKTASVPRVAMIDGIFP